MITLRLKTTNEPGAAPDYMAVKELSEIMERERAEARAAIQDFRASRKRLRSATASYRAARRSYWHNWGLALASFRSRYAQTHRQGGAA